MQKRNLMLAVLLAIPALATAEETTDVAPAQDVVAATVTQPTPSTQQDKQADSKMQDHVITLMEDDFTFETQKKQLANELALEKLRSEIRKLKEEGSTYAETPSEPANERMHDVDSEEEPAMAQAPALRALLISEIAGQKRVAVSGHNGGIKMVPLGQRFSYAGYDYIANYVFGDTVNIKEIPK